MSRGVNLSRRVSMADVARVAGVSAQTVSRVSNGQDTVTETTRQQVLTAMRDLGYRPNSAARALKRGAFHTLGVMTFTLSTAGNIRTIEGIVASAAERDYGVTLIPVTTLTQAGLRGAFTKMHELAVDGVIAIVEKHLWDTVEIVLPPGVNVVVADSDAGDRYPVVDTDQRAGARLAVEHLLALGHATVHHVAGPEGSFAAARRREAWSETLTGAGRDVPPPLSGDWSAESGYRCGQQIAGRGGVSAVFAANDQMALGVLRALHEAGLRVPADVSVVGFDDLPDAGSYHPPLTTIHQDFAEVGRLCVEKVLEQADGGPSGSGTTLVPTHLVVRESTAPAPRP